ncbi:MAG: winged helix-turn-helix domain-containing protein, partial [Acidobacteriota bacterium]
MAKHAIGPVLESLALSDASPVPLYRQLYDGLRDALLRGAIPAGHRLPSTRTLASDLGLSRNTVTSAYDRLLDEG